ncbi:MAG: hypothetical protein ACO1N0_15630 [Fluviicola sp.]
MKKTAFIFLIISLLLACSESDKSKKTTPTDKKEPEAITDLTHSKKLLSYLYHSDEFDTHGRILWLPGETNPVDYAPISHDSLAHTEIDTILYFEDSEKIESAAVILASPRLLFDQGKEVISGGHFEGMVLGVALFHKKDGQWKLYSFKKHLTDLGYFGEYRTGRKDAGKIALKKIGENWTCLSLTQGIGGNTGEFWGTETWYSIEKKAPKFEQADEPNEINELTYSPLNQLFSYKYSHNYYFPDLDHQNVSEIQVKTLPSKSTVYDLELSIHKYNYAVETNKVNSKRKDVNYFRYSHELNLFVEK